MRTTKSTTDDVKKRRDWLVSRVSPRSFIKGEELISATCYEHSISWEVGEEDLRIMLGLGKLVALEIDEDFTLARQIWRPGPVFEDAMRKQEKRETKALEIFTLTSDPDSGLVERSAFGTALLKAKLTNDEVREIIRALFRKGHIYESKPGFLKRLSA